MNQGVMIADDCKRIIYVNDVFTEMTDIPPEEIVGRTSAQFFPPEDIPVLERLVAQGESVGRNRFEFYLPRKDGGRVPVVITARRIEDPDGREFAVVAFTDITEQKRAEADLREANKQLEARAHEIEEELILASRVQQSLAPKGLMWGAVSVETYYQPVRTIGGDFGLVLPSENYLDLMVCDVSGHGISSALVANRIYTETMTQIESGAGIGAMMRHLNRFVINNFGSSLFFFTLAAARILRSQRWIEFAGAGHPPAMVVQPGEEPRLLESRSVVLGFLDDAVDGEASIEHPLRPGDRVVLYTDGLTDNFNANRDMLGVNGLANLVRETAVLPLAEMKSELLHRIAEYREGPPADDMSLVLVEIP
jgi:sigma-B regulation protein RsbU (phosphoserine phosphatase)